MKAYFKIFVWISAFFLLFLPYVQDEKGTYHLLTSSKERGIYKTSLFNELWQKLVSAFGK